MPAPIYYTGAPMRWYPDGIEVKAFCLIEDGDRWLVQEFFHPETHERYVRFLGGAIEKSEYARDTAIREVREELGCELTNVEFLTVVEHIFPFRGDERHQVIFIFRGQITDPRILQATEIPIEEFGHRSRAFWMQKADLKAGVLPLRPNCVPYSTWL